MNRKCRLFAGSILSMLALSVVVLCKPGVAAQTPVAPDMAAVEPETAGAAAQTPVAPVTAAVEPETADAAAQTVSVGDLSLSVSYGYDNRARGGRYVPVDATISNQGDGDFTGKLKLLTMESDYDVYRYEYPVSVPAGQTCRKHLYVPMGNRAEQMYVNVTDGDNSLILNERVPLNFSVEIPELFIGTLTDTPDLLTVWDGVGVDYSMLRTRVVSFDAETFPADEMGLDLFDVLLISNFRIRDLSSAQSQVLIEWVRSGGTMILGTGLRADDTLGRFAPELLEESYDPPVVREVDMGDEYAMENPADATLMIPCLDFSLSGGEILFADEQQALVASVSYGKGTIAVAAYDFADIESFCRRNPAYMDDLLTAVLGETKLAALAQAVYSGNSDAYWSVRAMLNTGNVRQLPNLGLYTLEIVIYLFLAGLAIYIFLKQRDLTEYYRRCVVVLALLFSGIIYFMGSRTRFTGTFYNYAQFLETTFDSVSETSYINIRAPYNRPYQAHLPSGYSVKPITRSYYSEEMPPRFTGGETPQVSLSFGEEKTVISIQGVPAFEPRYFQLNKVRENTNRIGFDGDLEMDGGRLTGSVTNLFPQTVRSCALLFNNKLIRLGDMEPAQTVEIDDIELMTYPKSASYQVAAYLSGESSFEQADISNEEYVKAAGNTDMIQFYLDNHMPYFTIPKARIVGIAEVPEAENGVVSTNGAAGITMVSSTVSVYSSDDEVLYRSALIKSPTVLAGSYDAAANTLYGVDPLTLEYDLGTDVQVEKLEFDYVSEVFAKQSGSGLAVFEGNIYFYNHLTGVYDEMDSKKTEYGAHELLPYLTDDNKITVRYYYGNLNQYNWNILLPMLNIVGREY